MHSLRSKLEPVYLNCYVSSQHPGTTSGTKEYRLGIHHCDAVSHAAEDVGCLCASVDSSASAWSNSSVSAAKLHVWCSLWPVLCTHGWQMRTGQLRCCRRHAGAVLCTHGANGQRPWNVWFPALFDLPAVCTHATDADDGADGARLRRQGAMCCKRVLRPYRRMQG